MSQDSAPTPEEFRALARTSPRAWSTIRLLMRTGPGAPIRAWIVRPDQLRVESHLGEPLHVDATRAEAGSSRSRARRWLAPFGSGSYDAPPPDERPEGAWWRPDDTVPMYRDYRWVALLEPLELADSWLPPDELPDDGPPVRVHSVERHRHHGRSVLAATVSTAPSYHPRCSCCPLLPSADAVRAMADDGLRVDTSAPATRFLVLLDEGTGICVSVTELDGPDVGRGFDVAIEEVDEPYGDELFVPPDGPRRIRSWRR